MITKAIEVRDRGTFIPVLAIQMISFNERDLSIAPQLRNLPADAIASFERAEQRLRRKYLLERGGYSEQNTCIVLMRMSGASCEAHNCPDDWFPTSPRTLAIAHEFIEKMFDDLADGDVVDVEHIMGETKTPKISERLSAG